MAYRWKNYKYMWKRERIYETSNYTNTVMSYKCIAGVTPPPLPSPPTNSVQFPTVNLSANPYLVNYNGGKYYFLDN